MPLQEGVINVVPPCITSLFTVIILYGKFVQSLLEKKRRFSCGNPKRCSRRRHRCWSWSRQRNRGGIGTRWGEDRRKLLQEQRTGGGLGSETLEDRRTSGSCDSGRRGGCRTSR